MSTQYSEIVKSLVQEVEAEHGVPGAGNSTPLSRRSEIEAEILRPTTSAEISANVQAWLAARRGGSRAVASGPARGYGFSRVAGDIDKLASELREVVRPLFDETGRGDR